MLLRMLLLASLLEGDVLEELPVQAVITVVQIFLIKMKLSNRYLLSLSVNMLKMLTVKKMMKEYVVLGHSLGNGEN